MIHLSKNDKLHYIIGSGLLNNGLSSTREIHNSHQIYLMGSTQSLLVVLKKTLQTIT
jgi:hypothetical protein